MPASTMPMNSPPMMLIRIITMPAMASPRTNLLAPSIAPKKSACCETSCRRRWASRSSITPAFRSASIAICLPGIPSRVNRAATSLMRVAPLVMTTNWISTMIEKITRPTTILSVPVAPPVTNSPKVRTTPPAAISSVGACSGENQSRGGHVQHQTKQRGGQQQRRKDVELQAAFARRASSAA